MHQNLGGIGEGGVADDDVEAVENQALGFVFAEENGLAFFELNQALFLDFAVDDVVEGTVVEDHAVLPDLDQGQSLVLARSLEDGVHVAGVGVPGAGDKSGAGGEGEEERIEGRIDRAVRSRFGHLVLLGGGRVLALGETVDAVVEEQDDHLDVAADRVHQVVAADRQAIAVTSDHPDIEVGAGDAEAGGDGRGAAVDGVEAVGVHVDGETRRAADAGDDDLFVFRATEVGHGFLDGGEDGVIAAAGAPLHIFGRGEVFLGVFDGSNLVHGGGLRGICGRK